jgi:small subunit ribosomal protein S20
MPNTKSAERRMRNSARKNLHNRSIASNLRRLEREFRAVIGAGKKDEAVKLLPGVHSAYDKAVKSGVVKRPTANRKKSRLSLSLAAKPAAAAAKK